MLQEYHKAPRKMRPTAFKRHLEERLVSADEIFFFLAHQYRVRSDRPAGPPGGTESLHNDEASTSSEKPLLTCTRYSVYGVRSARIEQGYKLRRVLVSQGDETSPLARP